jgi:hypothetical protein
VFDAGAIQAHLDVDLAAFNRKLDEAEARVKRFEDDHRELKITPVIDQSEMSRARQEFSRFDQQLTRDAIQRSRGSQGSVLGGLFGGKSLRTAEGGSGGRAGVSGLTAASLLAGIGRGGGPGILGISARNAAIVGGGGILAGALPAAAALGGALGVGAVGAGVIGLGAKTLIGTKKDPGQLYGAAQPVGQAFESTMKAAAQPLVAPLRTAFAEIPKMLHDLLPDLKQLFASAGTLIQPLLHGINDLAHMVLPGLSAALRAVAPLLRPILDGFGQLIAGILPGLVSLLRAAAPVITVIAGVLGTLGRDLGSMLSDFAPVLKQSAVIFKALFDVVGALLPIIGQLAAIFARALAPIVSEFAKILVALMPTLIIVGKVIADLAGAVILDLVAAFKAIADVIIGISPALSTFAKAFSQVFTVLENSGVFAVIASALEAVSKPLATMISQILVGLTPLLPPLIKFLGQVTTVLAKGLASAIIALLPPLTTLAMTVIQALVELLPILLPLFTGLVNLLTPVFVRVIQDLALALSAVIRAVPASVLRDIALGFLAIWAAIKIGGLIASVSNPVTLIAIAVGLLIVGIVELAKHWNQVWTNVKNWAKDAWEFLTHGWGQFLMPGLTLIRLAVEFVRTYWRDAWQNMKDIGHNFYTWLWSDFGAKIVHFITVTLPNAWSSAVDSIRRLWGKVEDVVKAPVKFVIDNVLDGLISVFDTITGAIGLGSVHINQVHPFGLAAGGRITAGTGPVADDVLIRASKDETVVSAADSKTLAPIFAWLGIPGYQTGGRVGQPPSISAAQARFGTSVSPTGGSPIPGGGIIHNVTHAVGQAAATVGHAIAGIAGKAIDVGKMGLAFVTGNRKAFENAFADLLGLGTGGAAGIVAKILTQIPKKMVTDLVNWIMGKSATMGSGGEIAKYAASFLGKIPYVWGGTAVPGGADCSGFVQAIYEHFGIAAPRTSEAQGSWVKRSPPTTGGLAFYHSPAGGADPGHVAIVRNALQVISQGGGMGPQLMNIHAMPLLWTGVPPGGLGGAKGGHGGVPANAGAMAAYFASHGFTRNAIAGLLGNIEQESGGDPMAGTNPPGRGLIQILGDPGGSLAQELARTMVYIAQNGSVADINAHAGTPTEAAVYFSDKYERPGNPMIQNRIAGANASYAAGYAKGGVIREPIIGFGGSGRVYTFGENGAEYVTPAGPGGGPPGGAMIGNVHIQLPEGQTVARALSELTYWLKVAQQQGFAGVLPGG